MMACSKEMGGEEKVAVNHLKRFKFEEKSVTSVKNVKKRGKLCTNGKWRRGPDKDEKKSATRVGDRGGCTKGTERPKSRKITQLMNGDGADCGPPKKEDKDPVKATSTINRNCRGTGFGPRHPQTCIPIKQTMHPNKSKELGTTATELKAKWDEARATVENGQTGRTTVGKKNVHAAGVRKHKRVPAESPRGTKQKGPGKAKELGLAPDEKRGGHHGEP